MGKLRIIAGELGGRVIQVPEHPALRPTTDRARGGIFSSLESVISLEGAVVLDLFAGGGLLGIEALSRGASKAVFVEADRKLAEVLRQNLMKLGVEKRSEVVRATVPDCLKTLRGEFTVVFADPPYDQDFSRLPKHLEEMKLVTSGSLLVFETRKGSAPLQFKRSLSLELKKDKSYGDSSLRIYSFELPSVREIG